MAFGAAPAGPARRALRAVGEMHPAWQVTIAGAVGTAALLLLPAAGMTFGLVVWARKQAWPSTRFRNLAAALVGCSVVGLALQLLFVGGAATGNQLLEALRRALGGEITWSANVGLVVTLSIPIAAVAAWAILRNREVSMSQSVKPRKAMRYKRRTDKNSRSAALRRAKSEVTPLSRASGEVVIGPQYREEVPHESLLTEYFSKRHPAFLTLTDHDLNRHVTLVGGTGVGKTEFLKRLGAGWTEARWRRYGVLQSSRDLSGSGAAAGEASPRPLTILVDAKGGAESGDLGIEWAQTMEAVGLAPERIGIFPFETGLDMWQLPATQLIETIHTMTGTDQKFYDTMQRGLLRLVLEAPGLPKPRNSVEFMRLIDPPKLQQAWQAHPSRLQQLHTVLNAGTLETDLLILDDLFSTLATDFDGGRKITDFDALFISLPGTEQNRVASEKAALLVELLKFELAHSKREVLFMFDEWSAVSRHVDVLQLLQTARSLGGRVVLAAQSYSTLGATPQEVERLISVMNGGHLVMRSSEVEPWAKLAGTRQRAEVGAQLEHNDHSGLGTLRMQPQFTVSPDALRELPERDVVYIQAGRGGRWAHVVKLDETRREPSRVILGHEWRQLQTEGPQAERWQLRAARQQAVQELRLQLTAGR